MDKQDKGIQFMTEADADLFSGLPPCPVEMDARDWACYHFFVVQGKSFDVISSEILISQKDVRSCISRARKALGSGGELGFSQEVRQESRQSVMLRLERLWEESMQAWRRSQVVKERVKRTVDEKGGIVEETETVESAGDVRYLGEARAVLLELREMLALDERGGRGGGGQRPPVINVNTQVLGALGEQDRDALRRLAIAMDRVPAAGDALESQPVVLDVSERPKAKSLLSSE